jgi:hypothetical protein
MKQTAVEFLENNKFTSAKQECCQFIENDKLTRTMKQTAVEWFEDQVGHNSIMGLKEWNEIFEQAKEMEKEQIIEAYESLEHRHGENYYNENYKKL